MRLYRGLPAGIVGRIQPGDWVIDVGASGGLVTAQLCSCVGSRGCVWAIEPVPRGIARLTQLRDRNHLRQLRVVPGALSATTGMASIRLPASKGAGSASFVNPDNTSGIIEVPTWRLDDLIAYEAPARSLALLKIDVEGFEPQVLAGAQRTLCKRRPLIYCEFNDPLLRAAGSSAEQLLARFGTLGYRPAPEFVDLARALPGQILDLLLLPPSNRD